MDRYLRAHGKKKFRVSFHYRGLTLLGVLFVVVLATAAFLAIYFSTISYLNLPNVTWIYISNSNTSTIKDDSGAKVAEEVTANACFVYGEDVQNTENTEFVNYHDDEYLIFDDVKQLYIISPQVEVKNFDQSVYVRAKIKIYENGKLKSSEELPYLYNLLNESMNPDYWQNLGEQGYYYLTKKSGAPIDMQKDKRAIKLFLNKGASAIHVDKNQIDTNNYYKVEFVFEYTTNITRWSNR